MGKDSLGKTFAFFIVLPEYRKSFSVNISASLYFILNNEYLWPKQRKNIFAKNFNGTETVNI